MQPHTPQRRTVTLMSPTPPASISPAILSMSSLDAIESTPFLASSSTAKKKAGALQTPDHGRLLDIVETLMINQVSMREEIAALRQEILDLRRAASVLPQQQQLPRQQLPRQPPRPQPPQEQQQQQQKENDDPRPHLDQQQQEQQQAREPAAPQTPHGRSLTVLHPATFNPQASQSTIKVALQKAGIRPSALSKFAMDGKELCLLAHTAPAAWAIRCCLSRNLTGCKVRMLSGQEQADYFRC